MQWKWAHQTVQLTNLWRKECIIIDLFLNPVHQFCYVLQYTSQIFTTGQTKPHYVSHLCTILLCTQDLNTIGLMKQYAMGSIQMTCCANYCGFCSYKNVSTVHAEKATEVTCTTGWFSLSCSKDLTCVLQYVAKLMDWIEKQVNDDALFPSQIG